MGFRVAVVGATGNVGREMLNILNEREFPATEIIAIASRKSMGQKVDYGDKELTIQALDTFDFKGVDIALFAAGSGVSKEYGPKAADAGAIVIDAEARVCQPRYQGISNIPLHLRHRVVAPGVAGRDS